MLQFAIISRKLLNCGSISTPQLYQAWRVAYSVGLAGGFCFSTSQKLKGGELPVGTQRWRREGSRAALLLLISPLQILWSFWVQREDCCYRNQWGKCTFYHVLYLVPRRPFNLSLPPCIFTETIMLIKTLKAVAMIWNKMQSSSLISKTLLPITLFPSQDTGTGLARLSEVWNITEGWT